MDVLARRRLHVLWELAAIGGSDVDGLCAEAVRVLGEDSADVPFALLFMFEGEARLPRLVGFGGVRAEDERSAVGARRDHRADELAARLVVRAGRADGDHRSA